MASHYCGTCDNTDCNTNSVTCRRGTHRVVHKHAAHTTETMILNKWQLSVESPNVTFPQATFTL
jgi:hypothetical protein